MAYATSADAAFRIATNGLKHGTAVQKGGLGTLFEKSVERGLIKSDAENTPISTPVSMITARVVHEFLDGSSVLGEGTTAANCTALFTAGDAGSGSSVIGPMVPGGWTLTGRSDGQGGWAMQQEHTFQGSALTETITY
jgi:hypothetical protein